MRSVTAEAAANIAFVKYWGAEDLEAVVPRNPSISMTLDVCRSICAATFFPGQEGADEILLAPRQGAEAVPAPASFARRVQSHLDRLRLWAGDDDGDGPAGGRFRIATRNTFPMGAGIASSASGFSALTVACVAALGREPLSEDLPAAELSRLARRSGSGSAARSLFGGYVEWPERAIARRDDAGSEADAAGADADSAARQLAGAGHWDLRDVIAIVQTGEKEVSSREGHRLAPTSPYFEARLRNLPAKLTAVRQAIERRDFATLGPVVEEEAVDLHLIAMSSVPPIFYWQPATLAVLERVRELRREGVPACATMDAGANVHVLCEPEEEDAVAAALEEVRGVERVLRDRVGEGPVWREGAEL